MIEFIMECSDSYDRTVEMTMDYYDKTLNDFNKNISLANIKVINESGTDDDYEYLYEAATSEFIGKAKKIVLSLFNALESFIQGIRLKINTNIVDKYFNKIKLKMANDKEHNYDDIKIDVPDMYFPNKEINTISISIVSRIRPGKINDINISELNDYYNNIKKKVTESLKSNTTISISDGMKNVEKFYTLLMVLKAMQIKKYTDKLNGNELKKLIEVYKGYSDMVKWCAVKNSEYIVKVTKTIASKIGV